MAQKKRKLIELSEEILRSNNVMTNNIMPKHIPCKFLNKEQEQAYHLFKTNSILIMTGSAGTGKALTLDSNLYSRVGPIKMKDVKVGDEIANPDGTFSKVTGVFPQGLKQVCRVYFSDETYVDCCEDHLWSVYHCDKKKKNLVIDTKYIETNCRRKDGKKVLSIPATKPVGFDRKNYIIPPYIMGILLAEGNLTNSNVAFSACESEIYERVSANLNDDYICKSGKTGFDHRIVKKKRSCKENIYKEDLRRLNLWGKYSHEKFIPKEYLFGSVDQRIALLQGMMDGDGTVDKKTGSANYCTTSFEMASDFCQLVYSLGGTTRIKRKEGSIKEDGSRYKVSYRCFLNLPPEIDIFFLERKKKLVRARTKYFPKRYIDRVERLELKEMQCIAVDHSECLYLTDNFTVTHNSHLAVMMAINHLLDDTNDCEKIWLCKPAVECEEHLGAIPGEISEKMSPYMVSLFDEVEKICKTGSLKKHICSKVQITPLAYLRGVNMNQVLICDEGQNATYRQLKMLLTRLSGHLAIDEYGNHVGAKLIITGDLDQTDLKGHKSGLQEIVDRLRDLPGVGIVNFSDDAIVRHPLIREIIRRLK